MRTVSGHCSRTSFRKVTPGSRRACAGHTGSRSPAAAAAGPAPSSALLAVKTVKSSSSVRRIASCERTSSSTTSTVGRASELTEGGVTAGPPQTKRQHGIERREAHHPETPPGRALPGRRCCPLGGMRLHAVSKQRGGTLFFICASPDGAVSRRAAACARNGAGPRGSWDRSRRSCGACAPVPVRGSGPAGSAPRRRRAGPVWPPPVRNDCRSRPAPARAR